MLFVSAGSNHAGNCSHPAEHPCSHILQSDAIRYPLHGTRQHRCEQQTIYQSSATVSIVDIVMKVRSIFLA